MLMRERVREVRERVKKKVNDQLFVYEKLKYPTDVTPIQYN